MLTDHPNAAELQAFLRAAGGTDSATRNARVTRHLLVECPTCHELLQTLGWEGSRLELLFDLHRPGEAISAAAAGFDYTGAFAKLERKLDEFLTPARRLEMDAAQLVTELLDRAPETSEREVQAGSRYAHPDVVHELLERSHAARYQDADRMLRLASLARLVADRCTAAAVGNEPRLADLRAVAWAEYGNSLRVSGRLAETEEALATAESWRAAGTGDPALRARLLEVAISLRTFKRQFDSAIRLAMEAGSIYRELGDTQGLARILVSKATAWVYSGEPDAAVRVLTRALPLIDAEANPYLMLAACHNLVTCYINLERPEEALSLHSEARDLYSRFDDSIIQLRATWQEGQLLHDLGRLNNAEDMFLRARKGFMERNLPYEVAVISLDLAAVYIKLGHADKARQTVEEAVPILRSLRIDRDTLAALLQLQQVADEDERALALIRRVVALLEEMPDRIALK